MTLKVVQLTDTHLFSSPDQTQKGVNTRQTLEAVVKDVAEHLPDFDALLLTGDLSQDETPGSYDALKAILAPLRGAPIHAIPGNHDDLHCMRARFTDDDIFVLADARLGNWRIAMLNSRVPGRVHGELGADQVSRLGNSLLNAAEHTICAMHHPPVAIDCAWLDASRCLDGDELLAVAANPPVKAVVCGHVHQVFEATLSNVAILTTPSTCVQFKPGMDDFALDDAPPGYRIFELEEDGRWSTQVRRIAPATTAKAG